ncbi:ankyrin repeat-containing domain protein [Thelonectria olida]|uniref:Ankyrin repeat-containing domain protein n=1 Tax=Thelonectria olida TaxID=1576542 RepID=A0A9P8VMS7_9HYPO|nr:ankyrin repeat-containing domain protein [Thelonectria olida]
MSGVDIAGLVLAAGTLCTKLALGLSNFVNAVQEAPKQALRMQHSLAALNNCLDKIRCLLDFPRPIDLREESFRNSISEILKSIERDLEDMRKKLRLDSILRTGNGRVEHATIVFEKLFDESDIREIQERIEKYQRLLQIHFEMLLLLSSWRTETSVRDLTRVVQKVLLRLLEDGKRIETHDRLTAARHYFDNDSDVDTVAESESSLRYLGAVGLWQECSNDVPKLSQEEEELVKEAAKICRESSLKIGEPIKAYSTFHNIMEKLDSSRDPNEDARTLDWCRHQGFRVDSEGFRYDVCDTKAGGDVKDYSPIHRAIKINAMDKLEHMLSSTCDLEVRLKTRHDDPTPLLFACSERNAEAVKVLLGRGAKVDAKDFTGMNGLHRCQSSKRGGTEIARLLLEHRDSGPLDIEEEDNYGQTAVHLAAQMGNVQMLRFLLGPTQRANVNAQAKDRSTPLMSAILSNITNTASVVQELLNYNADPKIRNKDRKTIEDIAKVQVKKDVLALLKPRTEQGNSQTEQSRRASGSTSILSDASTPARAACQCQHCPRHRSGSAGQDSELARTPSGLSVPSQGSRSMRSAVRKFSLGKLSLTGD